MKLSLPKGGPLLLAAGAAFGLWASVTGCQTYDFEPVQPVIISQSTVIEEVVALDRKPNVMLLVDTSASMRLPIDPSLPACQYGDAGVCGEPGHADCNPGTCPSRWSEVQRALGTFLADAGTVARFGLSTFPAPGTLPNSNIACVPTRDPDVSIPRIEADENDTQLQTRADSVNAALQAIMYSDPDPSVRQTRGGTPTGGSISFMGRLADLRDQQRGNFVLLLTDGLPNCNAANAHSQEENASLCQCTLEQGTGCFGDTARVGCLDKDATVAQLAETAGVGRNIKTVVVGFGAETGDPAAQDTLNAMATAGGVPRSCADGGTCGVGDTCDGATGLCGRRFYQAATGDELVSVLNEVRRTFIPEPCNVTIFAEDYPDSPDLLIVRLNGRTLPTGPDTWDLTANGLSFVGAACEEIKTSTPDAPAVIRILSIKKLGNP